MTHHTVRKFKHENGATFASGHTDNDGNRSVLFEMHKGMFLIGSLHLSAEQATELKDALTGWGF